ncbi:hypothetical protein FB45DRAFT_1100989 [Roridomyces roridus]|uniref:Heavy metal tolerance protein n=1 Tax=Roridomyces roridus TaxID=1738132 RepID=A0AAD7CFK8_9AGAR|nr:hypothetical protein FB45DRAFT_1100989 [Roridomyces roridus]
MGSALLVLRVLSPSLVALCTLSLFSAAAAAPPPPSPSAITRVVVPSVLPRRTPILLLLSLFGLTYLASGLLFVAFAVIHKTWPQNTGIEYNALLGLVAFGGLAALGAWKEISGVNVWSLRRVKSAVAASSALDLALVVLITRARGLTHLSWGILFPSVRVLAGVVLVAVLSAPRIVYKPVSEDANEEPHATDASFLLPPPSTGLSPVSALPAEASKYGTFRAAQSWVGTSHSRSQPRRRRRQGKARDLLGSVMVRDVATHLSFDPSSLAFQEPDSCSSSWSAICILIVIVGRVVNAYMPFVLGKVVLILEGESNQSVWFALLLYVLLRFLQGSGGLAALRDCLWAPVMQFSDREMSQLAFDHLLNLSFNFHTHRKTGEILRVLDRGAAINQTLGTILFTIIPTFLDIAVALVVFCFRFEWLLACVVFFVMVAYVAATVIITRWRTRIRRQMNDRDVVTRGIHTDALLNYETIKYFGGEEHEGERYRQAIGQYQELEYKVIFSLNFLNLVQNFIISFGLLVGTMLVALRVTKGLSKPSDFVIFITYLGQVVVRSSEPTGIMYRSINQSLVDTEKLLALLSQPTDINDREDAMSLVVNDGEIEFDNVSFSYDPRTTALNGVSFKVPKGSSVALVGESGAGKSTILRLLYRFYDLPQGGGRILIDGQDIRNVTQKSLRAAIGVVPQDCVLFNSSIGYNIGYGKFGSTPEEIEQAAKSAQMHERIVTFPDGYDTTVGERGVRLSGGEKQRVAIARTLLKNPPILLLDEATSALDSHTEKDIQKALQNLVAGRSSLSIAHRLSTIASADLILVLKDGQIVEQGSHTELLALGGVFASMWAEQISASGEAPTPAGASDPLPEAEIVGYSAEPDLPVEIEEAAAEQTEVLPEVAKEEPVVETAAPAEESEVKPEPDDTAAAETITFPTSEPPVSFPTSPEPPAAFPTSPAAEEQVSFPASPAAEEPVSFPVSSETEEVPVAAEAAVAPSPGVTFEPDSEPKRKRISSQNFQRLARRISITTRRQGSTSSIAGIIPGLKRAERGSGDDSSVRDSIDSPTASLSGDKDKGKKKKEKKDKRKSTA